MNGLSVPAFGLDTFAVKLNQMVAMAPREMSLVENVILYGLGASAILLLLWALIRRSAVAVVSFSVLALTGLVMSLMFGKLDFIPTGTHILIECLFACSVLLFLTASVRIARENSLVGAIVLGTIFALLVIGGVSALSIFDGAHLARLGLLATYGMTAVFVVFEIMRGDRTTLTIAPGMLLALVSPLAMSMSAGQTSEQGWLMTALPVMMMAFGIFYATIAAQFSVSLAKAPVVRSTAAGASVAGAGVIANTVPLLREVEDDPQAGDFAQSAPADHRSVDDYRPSYPTQDDYTASPAEAISGPFESSTPHQSPYASATPEPVHAPTEPQQGSHFTPVHTEAVSAQWGSGQSNDQVALVTVAADEYVWDMMADQEVKMGDTFADLLARDGGGVASPDVLRDAIAPASLDDFDESILGGNAPQTGRFSIDVTTHRGDVVRLEGRRQVDHDGLLMRIEARAEKVSDAIAPTHKAALTATPSAAAPLAARRQGAGPSGAVAALDKGQILAHFQPIVRLSDGATVGFEALARWHQDNGNVVDAKDFVSELIDGDRGLDLAGIIIDRAAAELSAWMAAEPNQGQFVAVNIAAADMPKDGLSDLIAAAVQTYHLPPGALVVELTEDRIQASQSKALAAAKSIRSAGASLAIDDFGVGYSTLNRLSKFSFDLVKLDKSIVDGIVQSKKKRSFIKAILQGANKSGSPVIAEGIEDQETADLLKELGCDFGQGYLFGRPEPVDAAPAPASPTPASMSPQLSATPMASAHSPAPHIPSDPTPAPAAPAPAPRNAPNVGNLR